MPRGRKANNNRGRINCSAVGVSAVVRSLKGYTIRVCRSIHLQSKARLLPRIEDDTLLLVVQSSVGRGGRPGLPVPNSSYSLCGRKETLNLCVRVEVSPSH